MSTMILATSALHFVNAVLLADQIDEPHLVLSGYRDERSREFLSWLNCIDCTFFKSTRYQFMHAAKQARPVLQSINPNLIITGNDDIREYRVLNYVAKNWSKKNSRLIKFGYMDDGLHSYNPPAIHEPNFYHFRNSIRYITKGYIRTKRSLIGQSKDLSIRYLYYPERFPVKSPNVINKKIIISSLGKSRLQALTKVALNKKDIPKNANLVLLPSEKQVTDPVKFLAKVKSIIDYSQLSSTPVILKPHPSASMHYAKVFSNKSDVLYLEESIPAELMLTGISPRKIYSGKSTIIMTAELLFPEIEIEVF